ncbi:MAG: AI-2E family transporter [Bacteroidota bacterium]|nr:AI-2E family transporter [Bacteroidota bacterium]
MKTNLHSSLSIKIAAVLITITITYAALDVFKGILIPLLLALLFAITIRPISVFQKKTLKFPPVLAHIITVVGFVVFILGILTFISWQISSFSKDWETIETNIGIHINNLQNFLYSSFGVNKDQQLEYVNNMTSSSSDFSKSIRNMVGNFILSFSDTLFNLAMIPIYMFLFLLYQNHLITFLSKLVGEGDQNSLRTILHEIKTTVQSYLLGVITQISIIALLTFIGLSIVGVQHALLLGVITGLLGLIPYLGNILACVISIFATLTGSPDLSLIIGVISVTAVVQIIDNNITVPLLVSSKVEINAFASIIGILIGGMIGGIGGMFLAIPLIAIVKVIFDNIPSLKPWGYLIGDDLPKIPQWYKKVPYLAEIKRNTPEDMSNTPKTATPEDTSNEKQDKESL